MNMDQVDYYEYIESAIWQKRAFEAKKRVGFRCQICYIHEDKSILDAHHRTYDRLGNEAPEDITVLCRDCHELFTRQDKLARHGLKELVGSRETEHISTLLKQAGVLKEGVLTGFTDLDHLLGGLDSSELITIVASAGMGKSAFVTTIASNVSQSGKHVAIFSLQVSAEQLSYRILSIQSGIDYQRLKQGNLTEPERSILPTAIKQLSLLPLEINDTVALTSGQLRNLSYRLFEKNELDLIVIDGLDLMQPEESSWNRDLGVKGIVRSLKNLARQLDVPILLTVQLGSSPDKRQEKRPTLNDIQKKGNLVQISDTMIFIYRDEYYSPDTTERPSIAEIIVAKHRAGHIGTIDLYWNRNATTFENLTMQELKL